MCLLFETIKIQDKKVFNLAYHQTRFDNARLELFNDASVIELAAYINLPKQIENYQYRCRVLYDRVIQKVDFSPYTPKEIKKIKIVKKDDLAYSYKFENRLVFQELLTQNYDFDELIITQNGFLTDATIANLAFFDGKKWLCPHTYLLKGTQRSFLLANGLIEEAEIRSADLKNFKKIALINAMRGLETAYEMRNIRISP